MEDLSTSEVQSNRPVMKIIVMCFNMQQKLNTFRSEFSILTFAEIQYSETFLMQTLLRGPEKVSIL